MLDKIIVGAVCLSIGVAIGFWLAAMFRANDERR